MELLFILKTCKRYFLLSIIISAVIAGIAGFYWKNYVPADYKTTIFLSIVTKVDDKRINDRFDPLSYVESADRFAEGMLGWFRNPDFFKQIQIVVPEASELRLDRIYQIKKQEKQNLNISFQVASQNIAEKLQKATIQYLRTQVQNINTQSNTTFDIINDTVTITPVKYNTYLVAGLTGASIFLLLIILFLLLEVVRGIVSIKEQAEEIFGKEAFDELSSSNRSVAFIGNILQKDAHPIFIGFLGLSTKSAQNYFKQLMMYGATYLHMPLVMIDASLSTRSLGKVFGLSEHMKKMKGLTDMNEQKTTTDKLLLPLEKEYPQLKYLGAGNGKTPLYHDLLQALPENEKPVFFCELPEDAHIMQVPSISAILFIKLGSTKLHDLKRIKHLLGDASSFEFVIVE